MKKACFVSVLPVLAVLLLGFGQAFAAGEPSRRASNLGELPGKIRSSLGREIYTSSLCGTPRKGGFGTELPKGITAAEVVKILLPKSDPSKATVAGMKRWPAEKGTYIAIACITPEGDSSEKAICNLKGATGLALVRMEGPGRLSLVTTVISLSGGEDSPLGATWANSNLDGPGLIRDDSTKEERDTDYQATEGYMLDPAPYRISETTVAFGIRSGLNEGYAGGGANFHILTLFAVIGGKLEPVFSEPVYSLLDLAGDWNRNGTRQHHIQEKESVVIVSKGKTNGYYDLIVKSKAGRKWRKVFTWNQESLRYEPGKKR